MEKNVGRMDQRIRIALAISLLPLIFLKSSPFKWVGLLSLPLLITGMSQRCGFYELTGMNTLEDK